MQKEIKNETQPWLNSAVSDSIFILAPPFLALALVALFPEQFKVSSVMPIAYWVILVVFVDVAHVYATLYRTYFNPRKLKKQSGLLIAVPLICYFAGVLLHHIDSTVFWRLLAYLAVFHFIRQQYGFMRLYARKETASPLMRRIDQLTIYTATIYPIIFWHLADSRNFNWFVEGDFFNFHSPVILQASTIIYFLIVGVYMIKEIKLCFTTRTFNIPRNMLIIGTFLSWYFGIVYFNGDMAFTTLNVLSHGIPYIALIWFFEKKDQAPGATQQGLMKFAFGKFGLVYFVGILIVFAFVEEGLWDGLIWKERGGVFAMFAALPKVDDSNILSLLVPLLALPQMTHYVLDGFIWKRASPPATT